MDKKTIPFVVAMLLCAVVAMLLCVYLETQVFCHVMGLFGLWDAESAFNDDAWVTCTLCILLLYFPIVIESMFFVAHVVCYVWEKWVLSKLPWEWRWAVIEKFKHEPISYCIISELWK